MRGMLFTEWSQSGASSAPTRMDSASSRLQCVRLAYTMSSAPSARVKKLTTCSR